MSWWGKIIGGAFGYALMGPLGVLLGAALGHQFDAGLKRAERDDGPIPRFGNRERTQAAFFTAVFSVMGHVAKSDGRVSEDEIAAARAIMAQMLLSDEQKHAAIRLFTQGKQADFDLDGVLDQFRREARRQRSLMLMFIEVQLHAAYADGYIHPAERRILDYVSRRLGISEFEFRRVEAMVRAQHHFSSAGPGGHGAPPSAQPSLADAYAVLGVSADANDGEVKRAYRRLMNQHHPDKLVGRGMPEEMVKLATEKAQEIKSAYERIREARRQ
ncbi:MAG TPA: co-chaperone DjlA [Gammaproteobacteria bacterium]|nr:co-chaperone DjlA [Gammaproteobacteria bacterium]